MPRLLQPCAWPPSHPRRYSATARASSLCEPAASGVVHHAEIGAALRVAAIAGAPIQRHGARLVLRDAPSIVVHHAEIGAAEDVAAIAAAPVERRRARLVRLQAAARMVVQPAKTRAAFRVAAVAGALARGRVLVGAHLRVFGQRHVPRILRRAGNGRWNLCWRRLSAVGWWRGPLTGERRRHRDPAQREHWPAEQSHECRSHHAGAAGATSLSPLPLTFSNLPSRAFFSADVIRNSALFVYQ